MTHGDWSPRRVAPPIEALLEIHGDTLDPDHLSALFRVRPSSSRPPGVQRVRDLDDTDVDLAGSGEWTFSTREVVQSPRIDDHLHYVLEMLAPHRELLHDMHERWTYHLSLSFAAPDEDPWRRYSELLRLVNDRLGLDLDLHLS